MNDEFFQRLAILEAKKSKEAIGCGVVIVKNNNFLAKAHNTQRVTYNASAHAEINAIKMAGKKSKSKLLKGCTMYSTCEPCTMCLSAILFAEIEKVYFGTTMKETFQDNMPIKLGTRKLLAYATHKIEVRGGLLHDECEELIKK